jgi:ParB family chromosome partitioning protein
MPRPSVHIPAEEPEETAAAADTSKGKKPKAVKPPKVFTNPNGTFVNPQDIYIPQKGEPGYDPDKDRGGIDPMFLDDIRTRGVLQSVTLDPRPNEDSKYVVLAGRRRVRHALHLKTTEGWSGRVPVTFHKATKAGNRDAMISENEQRMGINPIAKATLMQDLLNNGLTHDEIGLRFRGSTGQPLKAQMVKKYLDLLDLDASVKKAVRDGDIAMHAAEQFSKLNPDDQKEALKEAKASGRPTARNTARVARGQAAETEDPRTQKPKASLFKSMVTIFEYEDDAGLLKGIPEWAPILLQWQRGILTERQASLRIGKPWFTNWLKAARS